MKSVKPGRGPSLQGGIGAIFSVIFGIIWVVFAAQMGAPIPFVLMGLVFVIIAGIQAVIHFSNATSDNRYSLYDITEEGEEPDPLEEKFGKQTETTQPPKPQAMQNEGGFCPFCGAKAEVGYAFCRQCGKKLP